MRILQLSDLHFPDRHEVLPLPGLTPEGYLERLAGALESIPSDLVVLSGDLALNGPSDHAYAALSAVFGRSGRPVWTIPGNHDDDGSYARFFPAPGPVASSGPPHCFAVEAEGHRLRFLDSSLGSVPGAALDWLRGELAGAGERVHLFMHHPPLLAGAPFMDRAFPLLNHEETLAVLEAATVPVSVFCGHYHCARDVVRGRVTVHITPSTLLQLDPEAEEFAVLPDPPACRLIEIDRDSYRTWVRELWPRSPEAVGDGPGSST